MQNPKKFLEKLPFFSLILLARGCSRKFIVDNGQPVTLLPMTAITYGKVLPIETTFNDILYNAIDLHIEETVEVHEKRKLEISKYFQQRKKLFFGAEWMHELGIPFEFGTNFKAIQKLKKPVDEDKFIESLKKLFCGKEKWLKIKKCT